MRNNRLPYANESIIDTGNVQPNVGDWTTCEGCKLLVAELRNIIKNPQEVANLKEILSRVCQMGILSHYKAECLNMVNNLIVVLHEIEPLLDNPTAVCQELQYCPTAGRQRSITPAKRVALLLGYKLLEMIRPGRSNDVICDECIFAVSELKSLIQSKSIQDELKGELHRLCRSAGQYESECDALVDQYFELLIQEAVNFLSNGRAVCVDIGMCNSQRSVGSRVSMSRIRPAVHTRSGRVQLLHRQFTSLNTPKLELFQATFKRIQTRQGINAGCLVCRAAYKEAIDVLSQERVATMVTTDLTKFACGLLPSSMKTDCTDFMNIYSRAFLQMILTEYTPPQFCSAIHMCKPEDGLKIDQLSPSEKSATTCEACQVLSQYLSFEFQQPDFQQEIVNTLKRACTIFPGDYVNQCENSLVNYVPTTLAFFADFLGRNVVCATLGMCPSNQQITSA
jgi:saposin